MPHSFRRTRFIFTIGPATEDVDTLTAIIDAGAEVCRINMAHASHDWTRKIVKLVNEVAASRQRTVAMLMDIKGPEIRTGLVNHPIELKQGDPIHFVFDPSIPLPESSVSVTVNYPHLGRSLKPGATLLVDNGLLRFEVLAIEAGSVRCRTIIAGTLTSRRHVNLPGTHVDLPALTEKDRVDLELGVELGMDFFALSFVRSADDLHTLRNDLANRKSEARIIAKIEDQSAISNLHSIISASDGLMVARGDLGVECPFEQLPGIQRDAVGLCLRLGKPVIIATHVLESMIENPIPTRAEVTDAANAMWERADGVMLSGETSQGKYPVDSIRALHRISTQIQLEDRIPENTEVELTTPKALMLRSAEILAEGLDGAGLVVFTRNGLLAQILSSLRPRRSPIYAFTDKPTLYRQLHLLWGVKPFLLKLHNTPDASVHAALNLLHSEGYITPDEWLVVIANILASDTQIIDSIQLRRINP